MIRILNKRHRYPMHSSYRVGIYSLELDEHNFICKQLYIVFSHDLNISIITISLCTFHIIFISFTSHSALIATCTV